MRVVKFEQEKIVFIDTKKKLFSNKLTKLEREINVKDIAKVIKDISGDKFNQIKIFTNNNKCEIIKPTEVPSLESAFYRIAALKNNWNNFKILSYDSIKNEEKELH